MTIRVLVVDDSPVVRQALVKALGDDPALEVVGVACDPAEARTLVDACRPDVLTLDVEMPGMDGLTFLGELMRTRPTRVVMVSSKVRRSSQMVLDAMRAGAAAVLPKPHAGYPLPQMLADLRQTLRDVAARPLRAPRPTAVSVPGPGPLADRQWIVAVGASTGGTQAFETFLRGLPVGHPCVLLAQHLPGDFVQRFAARLGDVAASEVLVARGGERCRAGTVFVAPGTHHLRVARRGGELVTELFAGPPVNQHVPSADVLLSSVARECGRSAIGVLLTGMGVDGAQGLLDMRRAGAATFAQDEATSVVFGMPRAARDRGAVEELVPIGALAARVMGRTTPRARSVPG